VSRNDQNREQTFALKSHCFQPSLDIQNTHNNFLVHVRAAAARGKEENSVQFWQLGEIID
jgi:hypothetical protein